MRIQLARSKFLVELGLIQGIAERRPTIPILSHLLLDAKDSGLTLKATDLDVSLLTRLPAESDGEASVALKAAMLHQIVRALEGDELELELQQNNEVVVSAGRSEFRLRGLPAEDFPTLPEMPEEDALEVPSALLRRMIARVLFAVASDETRYQLNGALIEQGDGLLTMVATDGYRLALVENELEEANASAGVIVPRKALAELQRIEHDGDASFRQGEQHLAFGLGDRELICRNLEGTFPDYQRVIAKDRGSDAVFDRRTLADAVGRVALLTGDRARGVKLAVSQDAARVSANNPDLGRAVEELACEYDGEETQFGVNPEYLGQFLAALETEKVAIAFKDEASQAVGMPVEGEDGRFLCVIMPMRL